MARQSKSTVVKESKNRFRMLRFKNEDDIKGAPSLTVDDMVEKTGLSKGLISKLEKQDLDDNQAPSCNASTLKILHDTLGISYEYLMGETNLKYKKTQHTNDPILSNLNDEFWSNLSMALVDEWSYKKIADNERIALLRMLISSPKDFGSVLDAMFEYMYQIYRHTHALGLDPESRIVQDSIGQYEYSFNSYIDQFLKSKIYPHMNVILEEHHKKSKIAGETSTDLLSDLGDIFKE